MRDSRRRAIGMKPQSRSTSGDGSERHERLTGGSPAGLNMSAHRLADAGRMPLGQRLSAMPARLAKSATGRIEARLTLSMARRRMLDSAMRRRYYYSHARLCCRVAMMSMDIESAVISAPSSALPDVIRAVSACRLSRGRAAARSAFIYWRRPRRRPYHADLLLRCASARCSAGRRQSSVRDSRSRVPVWHGD